MNPIQPNDSAAQLATLMAALTAPDAPPSADAPSLEPLLPVRYFILQPVDMRTQLPTGRPFLESVPMRYSQSIPSVRLVSGKGWCHCMELSLTEYSAALLAVARAAAREDDDTDGNVPKPVPDPPMPAPTPAAVQPAATAPRKAPKLSAMQARMAAAGIGAQS